MLMTLWTIYRRPRDFQNHYVVRKFENEAPTGVYHLANTLHEIRKFIPDALVRIERDKNDHPSVVETWI